MRYSLASEVEKAVRDYFLGNGNVVLSQVRNGTGFERSARTADMMVFSTWPSRGLYCDGVEIKVNRSDLKSELANPKKADDIAKYCRCWWLAVPDDLITPDMQIPEPWGVLHVSIKGKVSIAKKATVSDPIALDQLLVCSVLRNFAESYTLNSEIDARVQKGIDRGLEERKLRYESDLDRYKHALEEFREVTGVDLIDGRGHPIWDIKGAGAAVQTIMAMRQTPAEHLRKIADDLRKAGEIVEAAMDAAGVTIPT